MPALFFPNPDAVRLAIAAGIVPSDVARSAVRAGLDANGRAWVERPEELTRDAVAALQRIGVQFLPPGTVPPTKRFDSWGELLALRPSPSPPTGPVLLEIPDSELARTSAEVVRIRPQRVRTRFLPLTAGTGRAWLLTTEPPVFTLAKFDLAGDPRLAEAFVEQSPRAWVRVGWRHPLDDRIPVPEGFIAVLRPPGRWTLFPDEPFAPERDVFPLGPTLRTKRGTANAAVTVEHGLRLRPIGDEEPATFWAFAGDEVNRLIDLARGTDERLLRQFHVASVRSPAGQRRVLLRVDPTTTDPPILPAVDRWVAHHEAKNFYLPHGRRLAPVVRWSAISERLGVRPNRLTWLELTENGGFVPHSAPTTAFRPLLSRVDYRCPEAVALIPVRIIDSVFGLPRFSVMTDAKPEVLPPPRIVAPPRPEPVPQAEPVSCWLARSLKRVLGVGSSRKKSKRKSPANSSPDREPTPAGRAGEKLSSPQILLLGNEWAARRSALENRVLADLPGLPPANRAEVWADLAEVYAAVGNPADAAVCWANAIWDRDPPPSAWLVNWLKAESRAAHVGKDRPAADTLVESPPTVQTARVAAAFLAWAGGPTSPAGDIAAYLPYLLELLETHEADLPARSVWLARTAAAKLTDGDPLGLARCRDRLFRRLVDEGPGLDLDAPSFLRFQGTAGGDRFQSAREWLTRLRDQVRKWLEKLAGAGRLQWAGLDPEFGCTAGYADLMIAWGLSKLGDRGRSKDLESAAAEQIAAAAGSGVDPVIHRVLVAGFRDRIRSAQDGRPTRPGLPTWTAADLAGSDDLGRYAIDRLRACSRILEPVDRVNPYRGRELLGFLGSDALGDRLAKLLESPEHEARPETVASLLAGCAADPTFRTLPRTILTLLEIAPRLDAVTAAGALKWSAQALAQTPEWVRSIFPGAERPVVARYEARVLASATHAAGLFHQPEPIAQVIAYLRIACAAPASTSRRALEVVAAEFFRAVRKLGLASSARELLGTLDTGTGEFPVGPIPPPGPLELGLAVGWFAVGNPDAGMRVLDAARDRLFNRPIADDRERTAVALGYAAGLGHAPTRVALGRLEELFLRLETIDTRGAANRYFTAQPLELIDTVIRSIVSDDFAVGPEVRGWLDDDEFLIRRRITRDLTAVVEAG